MSYLDKSVRELRGVGDTRAAGLSKLGIETIRDLVYFFPRAYERRGDVRKLCNALTDEPTSLILKVGTNVKNARIRKDLTISKFRAYDETGAVEIVFFNSPFVKDIFKIGTEFRFFGKVAYNKKQLRMTAPKYEPYIESAPLPDMIPVYPLTSGISSKIIDKLMLTVMDEAVSLIEDPLPEHIRLKYSLPTLSYAISNAHFPSDEASLSSALTRLAFDEMLTFGLGIAISSRYKSKGGGIKFSPCSLKPLTDKLPYELTRDQKNAVNDIYKDTVIGESGTVSPMARILVGDVGSGKTICAAMAIYICVNSGYQAALMVPTEILARQHFGELSALFEPLGIRVELLLGATTAKEKRRIYESISNGECKVIIGTHALISVKTEFCSLGLVVTDEQHRFGVNQRGMLKEKGLSPHMLVMSATPIPRTLALAMYGDLDVSRIVEMPKGRQRVDTFSVDESYRARINDFIRKQVALGGQCYIVCPSIEAKNEDEQQLFSPASINAPFRREEELHLKNAIEYTEELRTALPDVRIEYIHGRMKPAEKDDVMSRFSSGNIDVLVSTTVIEVGINVPNASLMIVENAERFGLSQLHQLRGRVGRGTRKSYCILVSDHKTEKSLARLKVMTTTYDGYEIAEKDLVLRGPGDFFSLEAGDSFRQSGGFSFRFAKLCDDTALFENAFATAKAIVMQDPELSLPEHRGLRATFERLLNDKSSYIS